jgi:hypothetical protein
MSPPPSMPVPPGPAARVDITPEKVDTAARHFATGQQDLIEAYKALSQQLSAHSAGMAGFDKAAHQFAAFYDPAAKAAFQAFHTAIEALGGTSLGLTHTVNNHLAADHHSRADNPGGSPPQYPAHDVARNFKVAAAPPSVIGAMSWAPSTTVPRIRSKLPHLPGWADDLFGTSQDWPQGNPEMFDQTGDAWNQAAKVIGDVASWLNWTVTTILDPADNAEHEAVAGYWATIYRPADSTSIISGLSNICQVLSHACHEYADAIRKATDVITAEQIAEIALLLGSGVAASLLRKVLGRLFSRAGAYMASAVTDIATRWAIRETLADLLKATANTKIIKAVKATFDKTVGRALGKDIKALASPAAVGQDVGEAYSGNFSGKRQAIADAINRRGYSQGDAAEALQTAAARAWEKEGGQLALENGEIAQLPALIGPNTPIMVIDKAGVIRPATASVMPAGKGAGLVVSNVR